MVISVTKKKKKVLLFISVGLGHQNILIWSRNACSLNEGGQRTLHLKTCHEVTAWFLSSRPQFSSLWNKGLGKVVNLYMTLAECLRKIKGQGYPGWGHWTNWPLVHVHTLPLTDSSTPWTIGTGLLCPWDCPGKNIGMGCHSLLQGIFPTLGSNLQLLRLQHCR